VQRKKIILLSAAVGAVAGALAAVSKFPVSFNLPGFAPDRTLLAHRAFLFASGIGWVIFSLYWEVAAKTAAPARRSESHSSRSVHVFLTNAALLLVIAPIVGVGRLLPVSSITMSAGLVVEAIGLVLAIHARRHLGRYWSGEITIKIDHELIRSGPYRLLRHPIYTGLLTLYAGTAIVTGEWLAFVGLAIAVFAYWRKIRLEERNLNMAFGAAYEAYRSTTWILVPGLF
jgi:protein-S-isoprenylcysteine O-methyltransferase Ste14